MPSLVGVSYGDATRSNTLSGVPFRLLNALERRYPVVARLDYSLRGWQKAALATMTYRPARERWQERFYVHPSGVRLRSRDVRRQLGALRDRFDLAVQVFGFLEPYDVPYVVYVDTTWDLARQHWPDWLPSRAREHEAWLALERRLFAQASHLFTMAGPAAGSLVDAYGVPAERVTVVGGGCNFDTLPAIAPRAPEPTILFVGREVRRKGLDVLLNAFAGVRERIPAARLLVAGLDSVGEEPGVEPLGVVSDRDRMAELYRRAGVFCLPSRYEPYGLVLVEAMAHGVPCVASDIPAFREILGETGLLVPAGDADALAQTLVRLLEDESRAERLGAAGRRRVEAELTWDRVVERMAPALERAAAA